MCVSLLDPPVGYRADGYQIFGVPSTARRAKPFIDHILTFSILDSKIWFRNFQVGMVHHPE
jgi:hypothetical protein